MAIVTTHEFSFKLTWKGALALAIIIALIAAWFLLPVNEWLESFSGFVKDLGAFGVLAFAVVYILATVLLIPGSPMTIAAGVAFGLWGIPLVLGSATVGACLMCIWEAWDRGQTMAAH